MISKNKKWLKYDKFQINNTDYIELRYNPLTNCEQKLLTFRHGSS